MSANGNQACAVLVLAVLDAASVAFFAAAGTGFDPVRRPPLLNTCTRFSLPSLPCKTKQQLLSDECWWTKRGIIAVEPIDFLHYDFGQLHALGLIERGPAVMALGVGFKNGPSKGVASVR